MRFDPELADIRFGCGLSPHIAPPRSVAQMMDTLRAPDAITARFPIEDFDNFQDRIANFNALRAVRRGDRGSVGALAAKKANKILNKEARIEQAIWFGQHLNRWTWTKAPLRERMVAFWADHFTATGKAGLFRRATSPYIETAIRPNVTGTFEQLLQAAILHPLMIHYLDQPHSVGPNSKRAANAGKRVGLNENLAREVLELHTLGVGAQYTQTDVTQLAELLTGVTYERPMRLKFRQDVAEPGAETVLGKTYGGGQPSIRDVRAVLHDLAHHPATARHIAQKLAVHFVSDQPDPDLVAALEQTFQNTRGDLMALSETLLSHRAAWSTPRSNVKPPFHFMGSALRALGPLPEAINALEERRTKRIFFKPLSEMGHVWQKPSGPDGLAEQDTAWITPQSVAARLQWAITTPQLLMTDLPDPRDFVQTALGPYTTPTLDFAARAAESRSDGVGLILASPAFQRT